MMALVLFLFCLISTAFSVPMAVTIDADRPCPSGSCSHSDYTLNPKTCKCYKFYPGTNTNYNQSKEICANDQAAMAIIADRVDNAFVSAFARNNSLNLNNPWIGLWCWSSVPSSCSWSDGSRLYYTNFAFGFPKANEPVFLNEYDEKWYSYDSSSTGTFICQQRFPKATEPVFLNEYDEKWNSHDSSSTGTFICQQMGINGQESYQRAGIVFSGYQRAGIVPATT